MIQSPSGAGVSLLRVPFTLLARWSFHDPDESGFSLSAGLVAEILSASSRGYDHNGSATVLSPGLAASARFEYLLTPRAGLFGEATLVALAVRDAFHIEPLGDVAAAPQILARGAAGLALHFF
jgi:hypothetical protein